MKIKGIFGKNMAGAVILQVIDGVKHTKVAN